MSGAATRSAGAGILVGAVRPADSLVDGFLAGDAVDAGVRGIKAGFSDVKASGVVVADAFVPGFLAADFLTARDPIADSWAPDFRVADFRVPDFWVVDSSPADFRALDFSVTDLCVTIFETAVFFAGAVGVLEALPGVARLAGRVDTRVPGSAGAPVPDSLGMSSNDRLVSPAPAARPSCTVSLSHPPGIMCLSA